MLPESRKLLFDIQHAAMGIAMFVEGKTIDQFDSDLMLRSAVERQFEIIGEAMGRLRAKDPERFAKIDEAPRIVGFRNALIHGYDSISNEITWRIITDKLPVLVRQVTQMLSE